MSMTNPVPVAVADLGEDSRAVFLGRVYQHLAAAVAAFVVFETLLFTVGAAEKMYDFVAGSSSAWFLLLGGFMIVNWMSTSAAHDLEDPARQYGGLFGLAAAEAVIFAPFLYYVFNVDGAGGSATVASAAVVTVLGFGGLTAVGLFGLELGVWFSLAMIGLAGAAILYQTQAILRTYPETAYVGAAVQLFASVMLLFWYVLRIFSRR